MKKLLIACAILLSGCVEPEFHYAIPEDIQHALTVCLPNQEIDFIGIDRQHDDATKHDLASKRWHITTVTCKNGATFYWNTVHNLKTDTFVIEPIEK